MRQAADPASSRATGSTPSWSRTRSTGLNEIAGNRRLRLRRRRPGLRSRRREDDRWTSPSRSSEIAARLCRADRHQRQHADPRQGHPPRIPPRRRRRVQRVQGQALARTASSRSASSRRIWRSSRPRARPPTGSSSKSTSRRSRPASCSCRPAIRASRGSSSQPRSRSATSWARARRSAPASTIRAIRKSVQLGFTEPYLFDKNILLGGDIYRRDDGRRSLGKFR